MNDEATAYQGILRDLEQELLLIASKALDAANVAGSAAKDEGPEVDR